MSSMDNSFVLSGVCNPDRELKNTPSHLSEIDLVAMKIDPKDHTYPFENLVFEGGGSKGLAYCGAVKVKHHDGTFTVDKLDFLVIQFREYLSSMNYHPPRIKKIVGIFFFIYLHR